MNTHDDALGPVNYVLVEFPDGKVTDDGFRHLMDLADAGVIGILDLEFFTVTESRELRRIDPAEAGAAAGIDLSDFDGASADLVDDDDSALILESASVGSTVAVIIWEDLFLLPALAAWERSGAQVIAEGPVLPDDLVGALDASESMS